MKTEQPSPTTTPPSAAAGARDDAQTFKQIRRISRTKEKDFYPSTSFLPAAKRDAACTLVAFCRMIEQAVAAVHTPDEVDAVLELFPRRIDEIYAGNLELPKPEFRDDSQHVLAGMMAVVKSYDIPKQFFLDRLEACRIAAAVERFPTFSSLERYLDRSVGSVALMLAAVFGLTHSGGSQQVKELARGLGVVSLLMRLRGDRDRGKIFLPLEDMARFRYSERDLGESKVNENFADLVRFELNRARDFFDRSTAGIAWLADDGSRLTAAAAVAYGRHMIDRITREKFDVFNATFKLRLSEKLRLLPAIRRIARQKATSP